MTYKQIQDYIQNKYDKTIKTCWIAHAKELCGLPLKSSPRSQSNKPRVHPCPNWALPLIKEAFDYFKTIDG
ncbi:MAG: hypothetical protein AAF349_24680 [Cyanobacteria bacterium P01_A01_bin.68]